MTDNEIRKNIQRNLTYLRKKHDLTQNDIAKITGKAVTTVATWEQGKTLPDPFTLYKLAQHYGVNMDYMYENTEVPDDLIGTPAHLIRVETVPHRNISIDKIIKAKKGKKPASRMMVAQKAAKTKNTLRTKPNATRGERSGGA